MQNEFYNGTTFHRIVTDFVDQGGDRRAGDGSRRTRLHAPRRAAGRRLQGRRRGDGERRGRARLGLAVLPRGEQERRRDATARGAPYKYSILGHMDAAGLKVAKKINTFGSADEAGTPTKTIYVFDVGDHPAPGRHDHHRPARNHPRAVGDAGAGRAR